MQIIRQALTEATDLDAAELACRSLLETSVSDGVVAFQRFCECKYQKYAEPPFNAFQRLKQGSGLWAEVVDKGYDSWVSENELMILNVLFQKRHLLAHREGIVDSKYIEKSGDTTYAAGQRIVILEKDVRDLVSIIEKLAVGINGAIKNS